MYPDQPAGHTPGNNYDFIMSASKPPKAPIGGGITKDPLIMKLLLIIGGAVGFMIIAAVGVNLFLSSKTNLDDLVAIAQTEQEVVRVSVEGKNANSQPIKNAAMSTQLSVKSQQQAWLTFLQKYRRKVKAEELALKKSTKTDQQLTAAQQTSTFDTTYTTVMRSQLDAYAAQLKQAYSGATNKQERTLLNSQYQGVQLLLKQWPEE